MRGADKYQYIHDDRDSSRRENGEGDGGGGRGVAENEEKFLSLVQRRRRDAIK